MWVYFIFGDLKKQNETFFTQTNAFQNAVFTSETWNNQNVNFLHQKWPEKIKMWAFYTQIAFQKAVFTSETWKKQNVSFLHEKCIPEGCLHLGDLKETKCELFTQKLHSRRLYSPRRQDIIKMWAFYTKNAFQKAVFTSETWKNEMWAFYTKNAFQKAVCTSEIWNKGNVSFLHEKCIPEGSFRHRFWHEK